jgi:hypothetical protein
MNGSGTRTGLGWGARLLVALVLVLVGASAAVWGLAHYERAARFLGIAPGAAPQSVMAAPRPVQPNVAAPPAPMERPVTSDSARIAALENRLAQVENATQHAEGSAGRADALVIAFAARRAIDRGVALGYLENLLTSRFGAQHQSAVATIITASHQPVRLNELIDEYQALGPELRRGGPQDSWWTNLRRELASVVEVHRASRPAVNAEARYNRALQRLSAGDVDQALVETMRLPGAARAGDWVTKARLYVGAHRALDEIESAALLPGTSPAV